jgi:hypothetical protein
MSSVRTVEGCDLASEQPGGEHRDVLARDRQNMCNGSEKDGKLVALQRDDGAQEVCLKLLRHGSP